MVFIIGIVNFLIIGIVNFLTGLNDLLQDLLI